MEMGCLFSGEPTPGNRTQGAPKTTVGRQYRACHLHELRKSVGSEGDGDTKKRVFASIRTIGGDIKGP